MNLVILGPPGAGKGTQARRLAAAHGLEALSAGDMLRAAVAAGNPLGRRVEAILARGDLVPDAVVADVIGGRMDSPDCASGMILDGFPRNLAQAEVLDDMLAARGQRVDAAVVLEVDPAGMARRIAGRAAQTPGQPRDDDTGEVLQNRLEIYRTQTRPLLNYYDGRGILRRVDGMAAMDGVTRAIEEACGLAPANGMVDEIR